MPARLQNAVNLPEVPKECLVISLPPKMLQHLVSMDLIETVGLKWPWFLKVSDNISPAIGIVIHCNQMRPLESLARKAQTLVSAIAAADQQLHQYVHRSQGEMPCRFRLLTLRSR